MTRAVSRQTARAGMALVSFAAPGWGTRRAHRARAHQRRASSMFIVLAASLAAALLALPSPAAAQTTPEITIAAGTSRVTEGTAAAFTLTRTGSTTATLTVNVSVSESGVMVEVANEGTKTATFEVNSATAALSVATAGDSVDEGNSVVTATVTADTADPATYTVGTSSSATVTVRDDDLPEINLRHSPFQITEGTRLTFTLSRTWAGPARLTVPVTVEEIVVAGFGLTGNMVAEANERTYPVTFQANSATATLSVPTVDDDAPEINSSVRAMIVANAASYRIGRLTTVNVPVQDNDVRGVTISTSALTVDEGATGTYTVKLNTKPTSKVWVTPRSNNSEVTFSPPTLVFKRNKWNKPLTVTVTAAEDDDATNDRATITHAVTGADYAIHNVSAGSVTVRVRDDEADTTAPAFASAAANGASLVITFDEDLAAAAALANSAFTVKKTSGGAEATVTLSTTIAPVISGKTVTLTLGTALVSTDGSVKVSYTEPTAGTANKLVDAAANETATFTDQTVTNNTAAPTNAAPTASNGEVTATEDTDYTFTAANFSFSDTDTGDTLSSVKITTLPAAGKGTLKVDGTAISSSDLPKTVTKADIDATRLKYSPPANANGDDYATFMFKVNDGTVDSAAAYAMTIDVTAVNDAPKASNSTVTATEDTDYTFTAANFSFSATDTGDTLSSVKITSLPVAGKGTLEVDGTAIASIDLPKTVTKADIDAGKLKYSPPANANGDGYATFKFKVNDGTVDSAAANTMTIDVTAVNDAPTASNSTVTATEDTDYTFTAADFNFSDADTDDSLSVVTVTALPAAGRGTLYRNATQVDSVPSYTAIELIDGGKLKYRPPANANGAGFATFKFTVEDLVSTSAEYTMTINVTAVNDNPAVTVSFGAATHTAAEGGTVTVTVTLSADPEREVIIPLTKSEQGGATDSDYSGVPATVTFNAGGTSETFDFAATQDTEDDDGESVKLGFGSSLPAGVSEGTTDETTVSITDDDDPAVTVSFGAATYTADEGSTVTVTVTLSADPEREVIIPLTKSEQGGATDSDYSGVPANLTFDSGDTSKTITFSATGDTEDDDGESVKLGFGSSLPAGVSEGTTDETTVSITDDDDPAVTVSFGAATYTADEGSTVTVTVTLSADPEREVIIPLTKSEQGEATDSDYSGVPANLTFDSGDTSKTITFSATGDTEDDDGESVKLGFGTLPARVSADSPSETTVSITDDDDPAVTVSFGASTYAADEGDTATVTVELNADPERTVAVPITKTNRDGATAADYSGVPASITFNSGDTSKTFTFTATQDTLDDDGESVKITFGTLPAGVSAGTTAESTVSITDDDGAGVTFSPLSLEIDEGATGTYTVVLDSEPTHSVTVTPSISSGDGFSFTPAALTFTTVNWRSAQTVTVTGTSDADALDHTGVISHSMTSTDSDYSGTAPNVSVTVIDDEETPVIVTFEQGSYSVAEGGSVTVKVVLDTDAGRTVTIPIANSNQRTATDADYSGVPDDVTFNSGETEKTFTFTATQDTDDDDNESVLLNFGSLPSAVTAGTPRTATMNITDDDLPVLSVSFGRATYTANEGSGVTVTVVLSDDPERGVIIPITRTNQGTTTDADYSGVPVDVTFSAGQTSKTITFSATADTEADDGESVLLGFGTLPVGVTAGATSTATVTISTTRSTGGGGGFGPAPVAPSFVDGFRATRAIAENAQPGDAVGDPVSATHPADLEITYSLSGTDASLFTVDEETGQISLREGVDLILGATFTVNLTATDSAGFGAIIIVSIEVRESAFRHYDGNGNGKIDSDEVIIAVKDYFSGLITKNEVIELIKLYFAAPG